MRRGRSRLGEAQGEGQEDETRCEARRLRHPQLIPKVIHSATTAAAAAASVTRQTPRGATGGLRTGEDAAEILSHVRELQLLLRGHELGVKRRNLLAEVGEVRDDEQLRVQSALLRLAQARGGRRHLLAGAQDAVRAHGGCFLRQPAEDADVDAAVELAQSPQRALHGRVPRHLRPWPCCSRGPFLLQECKVLGARPVSANLVTDEPAVESGQGGRRRARGER